MCSTGDPAHSPWWELCQDPGDFLEVAAVLLGRERLTEEEGLRLGGRRSWVQILPPTLTRHAAREGPFPLCTFVFSFVKWGCRGRCGDRCSGDRAWQGAGCGLFLANDKLFLWIMIRKFLSRGDGRDFLGRGKRVAETWNSQSLVT